MRNFVGEIYMTHNSDESGFAVLFQKPLSWVDIDF